MTEEKRVAPEPAAQAAGRDAIYELDGRISVQKAVPFGLQHVLAMFVANIAPILIVAGVVHLGTEETGSLVQTAMIIAGIGSLLQMFPIGPLGSRLPIVMGISFTFVSTFCVIGVKYGYGAILGAALVGGCLEGVLGLGARWWRRFVPPIVSASVVTAIGFSLLGIGANSFGGGFGNPHFGEAKYLIVGTLTLVACLVFHIRAHGFYKQLSVLFGLVVGYVAAYFFGMVDLSKIGSAGLFSLPHFLPYPMEFRPDAIFSVFLIFLVSATETLGDTSALSVMGMGRLVRDKEVSGSIAVDGFISALSSLFGCLPITSFSQNVGLVAMTHVVNRKAIASGAVLMILAGLIPALGVILASLPDAVLGGCTLMMFGSIVVSGVRMLGDCGFSSRNMSIAALSLSIGIGFTQAPAIFKIFPTLIQSVFAENCVAVVFLVAFLLNLVFPSEEALQRDEWEREAKQEQEQAR
jgi:xanthine permease